MSLRFPAALRARVRRYAKSRGLEEATAVRALCADRLRDIDLKEELELAERWQLQEALREWDRLDRGEVKLHEFSDIERLFADAKKKLSR